MKLRTLALLALSSALSADGILSVSYFSSADCATSLTSSVNSQRLDVGPCTPPLSDPAPGSLDGVWVSATANPFQVAVDGRAGFIESTLAGVGIRGSAIWDGELYAIGGAGSAFVNFQIFGGGTGSWCECEFMMPSLGIHDSSLLFTSYFSIPVIFGEPIGYTLSVAKSTPTSMIADEAGMKLTMLNFSVVDASGSPIPGASVGTVLHTPEPTSLLLLLTLLPAAAYMARRRRKVL